MTSLVLDGVAERPAPALPRLAAHAPVLRRGPEEWQVGIDPTRALVFTGPGFTALFIGLVAHRPAGQVRAAARQAGLSAGELDDALVALDRAGLLADPDPPPRHCVRLLGAGPVGMAVAERLLAADVARIAVHDDQPPEVALYPEAEGRGTRSSALRLRWRTAYAGRVVSLPRPITLGDAVDVTVVVADGPEVDRGWTAALVRQDQPHLMVRTAGATATVGPFVVPGTSSCLRCHDLLRRDRDPSWPTVLAQLARLELGAPAALIAWAAAYASTQLLAWLRGGRVETIDTTVELGADDFSVHRRHWPAHPECGCRWNAPTEWGP